MKELAPYVAAKRKAVEVSGPEGSSVPLAASIITPENSASHLASNKSRESHVDSGAIAGAFLFVDASFFLANLVKVADGGYVPLLLASIVYGIMWIWHRGSVTVAQAFSLFRSASS